MCGGEGVLRWRQPFPDGVLRELEHPCPNGCGTAWKHPVAQEDQVIGDDRVGAGRIGDARPARRRGNSDEVNEVGGDFVGRALEAWGFKD